MHTLQIHQIKLRPSHLIFEQKKGKEILLRHPRQDEVVEIHLISCCCPLVFTNNNAKSLKIKPKIKPCF